MNIIQQSGGCKGKKGFDFFNIFAAMNKKGKLYLIPTTLGDTELSAVLPATVLVTIPKLKIFVVEELRTARRFLSKAGHKGQIDSLTLYELNEHTPVHEVDRFVKVLEGGDDIGLMSEAGLPAVADPGALLVAAAQERDITVIPFVGPSSLMLALMGSGFNGQSFAFNGYLPVKPEERRSKIKLLEKLSAQLDQTQIMIETPYRNDAFFKELVSVCQPNTKICVAADITLPTEFIKTKTVSQWQKMMPEIGKRPCVFLIYAR